MFLDRRHPRFGNFNSAVPVDIIRVKSYVDSFLDPTGVPGRFSITLARSNADNGRTRGRAKKRRRSG